MPFTLLALAIAAAPLPHDLDALRADIATYSGGVPLLDPRLALAACAAPQLAWVDASHSAVSATCAAPAWRVFVAVQGALPASRSAAAVTARPQLLVRRGDAVTVNAGGQGFSVAVAGIAESDGAAGARIRVRNRSSGGSVLALVGADGSLRVQAQNPAP
ncbi:MAG TPA: flagella basal body P-ring formation protein FlgA [Polymorphobacter sp.]|nr:flagella basal body P-ring formation protein FlgA [Polymorphobacter sp.]